MRTAAGTLEMQLLLDAAKMKQQMKDAERSMGTFETATRRMGGNSERAFDSFANSAEKSFRRSSRAAQEARGEFEKTSDAIKGMAGMPTGNQIGIAGGVLAGVASFGFLRESIDYYVKVTAILRNATQSQLAYNDAMADAKRISRETQIDLSAVSTFYARINNSVAEYQMGQDKVAIIAGTVGNALKGMGATTYESASAMLQLSQGFQSGRLNGEEFKAIMESAPILMRQLAKSMGVTFGELKKLSEEGAIGIEQMSKAWTDADFMKKMQELAKNTHTVTGALTNMQNELKMLVGEMFNASGGTSAIVAAINGTTAVFGALINNMNSIVSAALIFAGVMGIKGVKALVDARVAAAAKTAADKAAATSAMALAAAEAQVAKSTAARSAALTQLMMAQNAADLKASKRAQETMASAAADVEATRALIAKEAAMANSSVMATRNAELNRKLAESESFLMMATKEAADLDKKHAESTQGVARSRDISKAAAEREREATEKATEAMKDYERSQRGFLAASIASISASIGPLGWAGLAMWGIYELADHLGWIDQLFSSAESRAEASKAKIGKLTTEQAERELYLSREKLAALEKEKALADKNSNWNSVGGVWNTLTMWTRSDDIAKEKQRIADLRQALDEKQVMRENSQKISDAYAKRTNTQEQNRQADILEAQTLFNAEQAKLLRDNVSTVADANKKLVDLGERYARDINNINEKYKDKPKSGSKSSSSLESDIKAAQRAFDNLTEKSMTDGERILSNMAEHMKHLNAEQKEYVKSKAYEADEANDLKIIYQSIADQKEWIAERDKEISEQRLADARAENERLGESAKEALELKRSLMTDEQRMLQDAGDAWYKYTQMVADGHLTVADAIKLYTKEFDPLQKGFESLMKSSKDALADFLYDFKGGMSGMVDAFSNSLRRMAAEQAASQIMGWINRGVESGGGIASMLGKIGLGGIGEIFGGGAATPSLSGLDFAGALSFDGGGYTGSRPRSGGLDGKGGFMAMLHPQETVIDHTKVQQPKGGDTYVTNVSFNVSGDLGSKQTQQQAAAHMSRIANSGRRNM